MKLKIVDHVDGISGVLLKELDSDRIKIGKFYLVSCSEGEYDDPHAIQAWRETEVAKITTLDTEKDPLEDDYICGTKRFNYWMTDS